MAERVISPRSRVRNKETGQTGIVTEQGDSYGEELSYYVFLDEAKEEADMKASLLEVVGRG